MILTHEQMTALSAFVEDAINVSFAILGPDALACSYELKMDENNIYGISVIPANLG